MDRKFVGLIFIIIGLILIAGIIYFIFFHQFAPSVPANNQPAETNLPQSQPQAVNPPANSQQPAVQPQNIKINIGSGAQKAAFSENDLTRLASSFAERFGSFSNQAGYSNIEDLEIFMTPKMREWSRGFVNQAKSKNSDTSVYYGITTKAIATEVKKFDKEGGSAEVMVKTQRRESTVTIDNASTYYQDIRINFTKQNDAWKVEGAYWQ